MRVISKQKIIKYYKFFRDRNQEFSACNFEACPVKEECNKILYLNKICKRDTTGSAVCSKYAIKNK